jgi:hypothetical protein
LYQLELPNARSKTDSLRLDFLHGTWPLFVMSILPKSESALSVQSFRARTFRL